MNYRDEDDPFEEDIVFDQAGLLSTTRKSAKSAIRRISSGKCATFSKTLGLCGAFLGLGLTCAIPGPISPIPPTDLENASLMSSEVMFRCVGFMVGSMFGGMLLDRFNRLFLVFLALMVTSILVTIIPWCGVLWLLRTDMLLLGAAIGFLSTAGNVLCLDLWGRNSASFMQALHFSLSLGVFLAPLLAQPITAPFGVGPAGCTLTSTITLTNTTLPPLHRSPRNAVSPPSAGVGFAEGGLLNTTQRPPAVNSSFISTSTWAPISDSFSSAPKSKVNESMSTVHSLVKQNTTSALQPVVSNQTASSVTVSPTNSTVSTTHRAMKPKPVVTLADKLDNTKNWDNVPIGKPPPEDLVPVSTTMRTTTHASNSTSVSPTIASSTISPNVSSLPSTALGSKQFPGGSTPLPHVNNSSMSVAKINTKIPIAKGNQLNPQGNLTATVAPLPAISSKQMHTASPVLTVSSTPSVPVIPISSSVLSASQTSAAPKASTVSHHSSTSLAVLSQVKPGSDDDGKTTTINIDGHSQHVLKMSKIEVPKNGSQVHLPSVKESSQVQDVVSPLPLQQKVLDQSVTKLDTKLQSKSPKPPNISEHHGSLYSGAKGANVTEGSAKLGSTSSEKYKSHNVMSKVPNSSIVSATPSPSFGDNSLSTKRSHHKPTYSCDNDTEEKSTVIDAFANHLEKYGFNKMQLTYLVVGMVLLVTSLLFLGFLCFNPRDPKSKTDPEEMNGHVIHGNPRGRSASGRQPPRWLRNTLISLVLLILMISSGLQAMYGQLLLVFAIQPPLQLQVSTGSALTAAFWGALTSTRFACILLASALSPTAMLVLSVALCSCATWLLSALATSSEVALWIGSVMVAVGTASIFPSGLLWMQRHVLITHRVASMLVMGPAMGEMILPSLALKMMVSAGPGSLLHLPALLSLCIIALWTAAWRLARHPRWTLCSQEDASSGYHLANQNDEDDLLDLTMSPIINANNVVPRSAARSYANGNSLSRLGS